METSKKLSSDQTPHQSSSAAPTDPDLPPVDGSLTVDQLYEWNKIHSPDVPCFLWTQGSEKSTMNWKQVGQGVEIAIKIIEKEINEISENSEAHSAKSDPNNVETVEPIVVGILSSADVVTYSTFLIALMRLTHPTSTETLRPLLPFPLSTRNSPAVIAHLLRAKNIRYIYVNEGPMRNILDAALQIDAQDELVVDVLEMPMFSDLYPPGFELSSVSAVISPLVSLDTPGAILHSSGSTAFPKPITLTHRVLLEWTRALEYGGQKWKGEIMALHASPVFHGMGVLGLLWSAANLFIRAVPLPYNNAPPPTPEYFMSQIVASGATMLYCVPSFLEAWAEDETAVTVLQKLRVVVYAGAPISANAGNFLFKKGVNIQCQLGATEYGQIVQYPPTSYPEGHEWFKLSPITRPHFEPQADGNTYELMFKETPDHHLSVYNTTIDGVRAYASNDLVEQHPTNKRLWRIVGRKDDQLMLSTGEKTNPGPIENIINRNSHVKCAVLFGRGRLQNGIIIEPESWDEYTTVEAFRDIVWPNIEEANTFAPSHSRIFKEMILVASPSKPFVYTPKRTPRRGMILKEYGREIQELYATIKESSQLDIQAPFPQSMDGGWSVEDAVDFVRKVVRRVLRNGKNLSDNEDFFEVGSDSLEATFIRNSIFRGLRETAPMCQIHKLPGNFVYQHPTIEQLGSYVAQVSLKASIMDGSDVDREKARVKEMDDMVSRYTKIFPIHIPSSESSRSVGEVILLTGSTGGLGSQILAKLVALPNVAMVYAFNRTNRTGTSPRDRQREIFLQRGNDPIAADSDKIQFIEGDTSLDGLGIPEELYNEIQASATTIIHNAWQVDFKMTLPSFEPVIRGVRNMVDLALGSPHRDPPRLLFTSSIGILRNWLSETITEAPVLDPSLITSSGYGASKWVSERILLEAAAVTPLKPVLIRVGQLAGGLNGCWNIQEWFPSLVRGSQVLGCFPNNDGLVSWVPLHVAAAAVIELRNTSSTVTHLVHPRPACWAVVAQTVAQLLHLPLVSDDDWLSALKEAASKVIEDLTANPAIRLLEFYTAAQTPGKVPNLKSREAMGLAMLETRVTEQEAPSLGPKKLSQLRAEDVNSWISFWRQTGFIQCA